jgi:hypothetical protein
VDVTLATTMAALGGVTSAAWAQFSAALRQDVARAAGIEASRVSVLQIVAGSVVAQLFIRPPRAATLSPSTISAGRAVERL